MKKRMIKKMANRYLSSPKGSYLPFGTQEDEFRAYNDGTPAVVKIMANFPAPVANLIREKARDEGWNGCHWDDPLLVDVDDTAALEYEEQYNPPHCW